MAAIELSPTSDFLPPQTVCVVTFSGLDLRQDECKRVSRAEGWRGRCGLRQISRREHLRLVTEAALTGSRLASRHITPNLWLGLHFAQRGCCEVLRDVGKDHSELDEWLANEDERLSSALRPRPSVLSPQTLSRSESVNGVGKPSPPTTEMWGPTCSDPD